MLAHFKADKDGADRVENLEELVNAAESFVMNEGFGRDAVALPVDETSGLANGSVTSLRDGRPGPMLSQSPASQGLLGSQPESWEDALAEANELARTASDAELDMYGPDSLWGAGAPEPELIAALPEDTGEHFRRWPHSSPTLRWKPATTRPRRGKTRCSS